MKDNDHGPRATGNTTRIVDRCVQELFNKGLTYVYEERKDGPVNREVYDRFKRRMASEHPRKDYVAIIGTYDNIRCMRVELVKYKK